MLLKDIFTSDSSVCVKSNFSVLRHLDNGFFFFFGLLGVTYLRLSNLFRISSRVRTSGVLSVLSLDLLSCDLDLLLLSGEFQLLDHLACVYSRNDVVVSICVNIGRCVVSIQHGISVNLGSLGDSIIHDRCGDRDIWS